MRTQIGLLTNGAGVGGLELEVRSVYHILLLHLSFPDLRAWLRQSSGCVRTMSALILNSVVGVQMRYEKAGDEEVITQKWEYILMVQSHYHYQNSMSILYPDLFVCYHPRGCM